MINKKVEKEDLAKKVTLKEIINNINSDMKYNAIDFASNLEKKELIKFGIEELDNFIGGGILAGNFTNIYGDSASGKSTLAMNLIAHNQKLGKTCVYFDLEYTFDKKRAEKLGVNLDELIYIKVPEWAEKAMEVFHTLTKNKVVDLIIIDSVQAMTPKGVYKVGNKDSDMEDETRALLPRTVGKFLNKVLASVANAKCAVFLINQVRCDINPMAHGKLVFTGGHALKHYSTLTLNLKRDNGNKKEFPVTTTEYAYVDKAGRNRTKKVTEIAGFNCIFRIDKHKLENCKPESSDIVLPFYFDYGFNVPKDLLEIKKSEKFEFEDEDYDEEEELDNDL